MKQDAKRTDWEGRRNKVGALKEYTSNFANCYDQIFWKKQFRRERLL